MLLCLSQLATSQKGTPLRAGKQLSPSAILHHAEKTAAFLIQAVHLKKKKWKNGEAGLTYIIQYLLLEELPWSSL